jgi:hypothetical protein
MAYIPEILTVPQGGTGLGSLTPYSVLCGGTSSTGALQQVSGLGTSGQLLISNGAGALPTWQGVTPTAFTPVLNFGGATTGITYTTQIGEYVQIGNVIVFKIRIVLSSKGSASGSATITGLPVTSSNDGTYAIVNYVATGTTTFPASCTMCYGSIAPSSSTITLLGLGTSATGNLADTNYSNTSDLRLTGFYY